jgi:hypothetical protein
MIGTSDYRLASHSLAKDTLFSDMAAERRIHMPLGQAGGPPLGCAAPRHRFCQPLHIHPLMDAGLTNLGLRLWTGLLMLSE